MEKVLYQEPKLNMFLVQNSETFLTGKQVILCEEKENEKLLYLVIS